jgi:acetyl-CoA C-acetyltransferase
MREVAVIGIGQTPIGELWDTSLRHLAFTALQAAYADSRLAEAGIDRPDALYVGNMLAARVINQTHLGALIADFCGWRGIEAATIEAACASGGVAFQAGVRAVASGMVDVAAVAGVEKMTDGDHRSVTSALATAADADFEGIHGVTFVALNALMMQRYMYEHKVPYEAFAPFALNAHRNGANNPNAMFQEPISLKTYLHAPPIAPPIRLYDSSPVCDGAAAAILVPLEMARDLPGLRPVQVLASATATDSLNLDDRRALLALDAARLSAQRAYEQAGVGPKDIDFFELHDAFTIMAALSLEAAGFAEPGHGTDLAREGEIAIEGKVPVATMGGLKARGHPVGGTGVYEIVDVVTQLRGDAGANQVAGAEIGMAQNIGGTGATIVTHILSAV